MAKRIAISPFVATILLVTATFVIGGILYAQFRGAFASLVRYPSIDLLDYSVASDRRTITLGVKNDGNVAVTVREIRILTPTGSSAFSSASTPPYNILAGDSSGILQPGDLIVFTMQLAQTVAYNAKVTITVVGDATARSFNVAA